MRKHIIQQGKLTKVMLDTGCWMLDAGWSGNPALAGMLDEEDNLHILTLGI